MEDSGASVSPWSAGLRCRCPRCGKGSLFAGFLTVVPACTVCGLDCIRFDSGDGPAVFVIFLTGGLIVPFIVWLALTSTIPTWLVMTLGFALIIGLSLAVLRPMKALLIALEFANKARLGELDRTDDAG